jgi:hypothetical protein
MKLDTRITKTALPASTAVDPYRVQKAINRMEDALANLATFLIEKVVPVLDELPQGESGAPDAVADGLSGATMYTDSEATTTDPPYLYKDGRPLTVKESIAYIVSLLDQVRAITDSVSGQITALSDANSVVQVLSGATSDLNARLEQLANDMYASGTAALTGTGLGVLTESLEETVTSLSSRVTTLEADKLSLPVSSNHLKPPDVTNDDRDLTKPESDMADVINNLRTVVARIGGGTNYLDVPPSGSSQTLADHSHYYHIRAIGTGTQSTTNIHALAIEDLTNAANYVQFDDVSLYHTYVMHLMHTLDCETTEEYTDGRLIRTRTWTCDGYSGSGASDPVIDIQYEYYVGGPEDGKVKKKIIQTKDPAITKVVEYTYTFVAGKLTEIHYKVTTL